MAEQQLGEFSITPAEGPVGTVATIASVTPCPPSPDPDARYQVDLNTGIPTILELPPEGGHWELQMEMHPASPPPDIVPQDDVVDVLVIPAACNVILDEEEGGFQPTLTYAPVQFSFTAPPVPPPPSVPVLPPPDVPEAPPAPDVRARPTFTG